MQPGAPRRQAREAAPAPGTHACHRKAGYRETALGISAARPGWAAIRAELTPMCQSVTPTNKPEKKSAAPARRVNHFTATARHECHALFMTTGAYPNPSTSPTSPYWLSAITVIPAASTPASRPSPSVAGPCCSTFSVASDRHSARIGNTPLPTLPLVLPAISAHQQKKYHPNHPGLIYIAFVHFRLQDLSYSTASKGTHRES